MTTTKNIKSNVVYILVSKMQMHLLKIFLLLLKNILVYFGKNVRIIYVKKTLLSIQVLQNKYLSKYLWQLFKLKKKTHIYIYIKSIVNLKI